MATSPIVFFSQLTRSPIPFTRVARQEASQPSSSPPKSFNTSLFPFGKALFGIQCGLDKQCQPATTRFELPTPLISFAERKTPAQQSGSESRKDSNEEQHPTPPTPLFPFRNGCSPFSRPRRAKSHHDGMLDLLLRTTALRWSCGGIPVLSPAPNEHEAFYVSGVHDLHPPHLECIPRE